MDRARHELLAGTRLALDQHRGRDGCDLLDFYEDFLDRGRLAEDARALLQPAPLDQPPHGRRHFRGIDRLHEPGGEPKLVADALGVVRRLDQSQRRDGVLAGCREQSLSGGFVQATGQDNRIRLPAPGSCLPASHSLPHVVERGDHGGIETRLLQRRVDPDGVL